MYRICKPGGWKSQIGGMDPRILAQQASGPLTFLSSVLDG